MNNIVPFVNIHTHNNTDEEEVIKLVNLFPGAEDITSQTNYYSSGVHPWYIDKDVDSALQKALSLLHNKKVIAAGEAGFDKLKGPGLEQQEKLFLLQAHKAEEVQKPIIIHCVRSYNILNRLRNNEKWRMPWVLHAFNSSLQMANVFIDSGCYLCFGHLLFEKRTTACQIFSKIPLHALFLETDESNQSILEVYHKAAQLQGISVEELKKQMYHNFKTCFRLP